MTVYKYVLSDSQTGHKRYVSVSADSPDEALEVIARQEQKKVAFALDPKQAAEFEKRLKAGELSGRDKAQLFAHQQEKPYKVQKEG